MKTKFSEILKGKSLGDDVIQAIMDEMKAQGVFLSSEENMDVRYPKLKTQYEGQGKQLAEAQALIENLQKSTQGQEEAQKQIAEFKQQNEKLQADLEKTQIDAEAKVGLLAAKAKEVDFLLYKLREKGELELDEHKKIKGWEDKLAALKTQYPIHFESASEKKYEENKLPKGDDERETEPETLESALRMQYENNN